MSDAAVRRSRVLSQLPLFEGCPAEDVTRAAQFVEEATVPAGYVLTHENDDARHVFVVVDGEAGVSVAGRLVATVCAGSVVGAEWALDGRNLATVRAQTPMSLLVLDRSEFLDVVLGTEVRGP